MVQGEAEKQLGGPGGDVFLNEDYALKRGNDLK